MLAESIATSRLGGKTLHMGLSGSIASVRALDLIRSVDVIGIGTHVTLTEAAQRFVSPLALTSFGALSVHGSLFDSEDYTFPHLDIPAQADCMLLLAATANTISKIASGFADSLLTTQVLAFPGPKIIAPAMNSLMWDNSILQENIQKLKNHGFSFVDPTCGKLACNKVGQGKLASLDDIASAIISKMYHKPLSGMKICVTLGATREFLDPVRFISNPSSGLMGACIANILSFMGADVTAICADHTAYLTPGVQVINVVSAKDMLDVSISCANEQNIMIFVAAVSDYTCEKAVHKIKKNDTSLSINFSLCEDIAANFGRSKRPHQLSIGFAAESENLLSSMKSKLKKKNFDLIVGNNIAQTGSGFQSLTNQAILLDTQGFQEHLPLLSKMDLGHKIADWIIGKLA